MKTVTKVTQVSLLGLGGLLLALGLMIWTDRGGQWVGSLHVVLGMVLVLSLWTLSAVAARSGVSPVAAGLAASWGFIVLALGLVQEWILPGDWHWTIKVTHVVISMGAIWWGRRLVRLMRGRETSARSPRTPETSERPVSMETSLHA